MNQVQRHKTPGKKEKAQDAVGMIAAILLMGPIAISVVCMASMVFMGGTLSLLFGINPAWAAPLGLILLTVLMITRRSK